MKHFYLFLTILLFAFWVNAAISQAASPVDVSYSVGGKCTIKVHLPEVVMQHIETNIGLTFHSDSTAILGQQLLDVRINGTDTTLLFVDGKTTFSRTFNKPTTMNISFGSAHTALTVRPVPLWMSLLPPLLAIAMALLVREVISALFVGLLSGTFIIWHFGGSGIVASVFNGFLTIIDTYIPNAILDRNHTSIILFSMLIGAMVNLISRNGGMQGIVKVISRFATGMRSVQLSAWLMGLLIFFDDYANTLVVGNTMRPVTDKFKISREKLAYIVDSTAAPVAAVAFVTTWIGAQLSYIESGIQALQIDTNPYHVFIHSLQYAFYPFLTIAFVGLIILLKREYGPMIVAERKAKQAMANSFSEPITANPQINARWYNAAIPVLVLVGGTIAGLIISGLERVLWVDEYSFGRNMSLIIGQADSFRALLWSSLAAVVVALILTLSQKLLSLRNSIESIMDGFRVMITAIVILIMAWAIAEITKDLHTADFISRLFLVLYITPQWIPAITFVVAACVSFSTGTSWGTMAILYPLILPATWVIAQASGMDYDMSLAIFYNVVSCVLAGSVFGDHSSPISDTTILSSLACSCNHIEHVRTQLPYAFTVGIVALIVGTIPSAFGVPVYLLYPLALLLLTSVIFLLGRKTEASLTL